MTDDMEAIDNAGKINFLINGLLYLVDLITQWDKPDVDSLEMRRLRKLRELAQNTVDDAEKWYGAEQRDNSDE